MIFTSNEEIFLFDEIVNDDDHSGGYGATPAQFIAALHGLSGRRETIVHLNSPGGSVFAGWSMVEAIHTARRVGKTMVAAIDGLCASIATAVALACTRVEMSEAALLMIHRPFAPHADGTSDDLQRTINVLDKVEARIVALYVKKTGKPEKLIRQLMEDETWFDAREAKEFGFVDVILTERPRLAALCEIDFRNMRVPERIRKAVREPVESLMSELFRATRQVRTAESYEDACEHRDRACRVAERLTKKAATNDTDLCIVASAIGRMNVHENSSAWYPYY